METVILSALLALSVGFTGWMIWLGRPRVAVPALTPTPVVVQEVPDDGVEDKARMLDEIFGTIKREECDEDPPTVVMDPNRRR